MASLFLDDGDLRADEVGLAEGLDAQAGGGGGFAEVDEEDLVGVAVEGFLEVCLEFFEAEGIEGALEDGVLDAGAVAAEDAGDLAEALGVGDVVADDVAAAGHGQRF